MKGLALAFAMLVGGGLLAFGITQEAPRGRVEGSLIMKENGKPLPKARVTLIRTEVNESALDEDDRDDLSVRSDANGHFTFPNISTGQYQIEVSAKAHSASQITFNVSEGEAYKTVVKLDPKEESLEAYFSQQSWLPSETPKFELTGFTSAKDISIDIYRYETGNLSSGLTRSELLYGSKGDHPWPNPNTKKIRTLQYHPANRDVEGTFVDQVKVDDLKEGLYALQVSAGKLKQRGFLNVTKMGLVTRAAKDKVLCYTAALDTGKPVGGAEIYDSANGQRALLGKTDAQGVFEIADNKVNRTISAISGDSIALLDTSVNETTAKGTIALITDRPVYKPGDMVQFKGIVRLLKGQEYVLPSAGKASIRVNDSNGNLVTNLQADLDGHGCFHSDWTSSSEAKPGYYSFEIEASGLKTSTGVSLAAYRKPEFSIEVRADQRRYVMGEAGHITVAAQYYYGAPVVGAKVHLSLFRSPKWNITAPWDESYDAVEDESGSGEYLENREAVTDEKGEAHLSFPLELKSERDKSNHSKDTDPERDYTYQVEAYVSDASGKGSQSRGTFEVSQGEYRVFAQTQQYVVEKGGNVDMEVATSSLDDSTIPVAGRPIQIDIIKERYTDEGNVDEKLGSQVSQTDSKGQAHLTVPISKRGSIRLHVTSVDGHGRTIGTDVYVYSESPGEGVEAGEESKFAISLDKKIYKVGDVAHLLVQGSGGVGAGALICVDGDSILSHRVLSLEASSKLDIPITEAMAPNGYISVIVVQKKKFNEVTRKISLDWTSRDLKIALTTDAEKYKPGALVKVKVKTTDLAGKPIPASLSLGCVDESIYAIRKDGLKIKNEFYPMRYNSVQSQYSFADVYLDGGDKSTVHMAIRRKFKDTATWLPSVTTGANGEGEAEVTLPDNLTTWRLTAVGVSDRTDVGQTTLNFRTWKPLMVRLDCPAYLVKDDRQQVTIGITNDTDKDADVKVALTASTGKIDGLEGEIKHIAAGKQIDIPVTFLATSSGESRMVASATAGDANDAIEKTFRIVPRGMMDVDGRSGELNATTETSFTVKPGADAKYGDLRIHLESSVASSALSAMDELIDYPYGCVEQTVDRFVPALVVSKLVSDLHLPAPSRLGEVPKIAQDSLARLAGMQHSDGGWGWWQYDASDPLMTCLVLDGLSRAKELGYSSTQIRTEDAWKWLEKQSIMEIAKDKGHGLKTYEWLAIAASLAEHGNREATLKAFSHFDKDLAGPAEWALVARIQRALGDASGMKTAADALHRTVQTLDGASHWLAQGWTGAESNTGFALESLAKVDPKDPLIPQVVRYMMLHRENGGWSTTLATAKVLSALDLYLRATSQSLATGDVQIVLNGAPIKTAQLGPTSSDVVVVVPRESLKEGANSLSLHLNGQGVAYYTASLRQFGSEPAAKPSSEEPGLVVNRVYRLLKPGRNDQGFLDLIPSTQPVDSAQSGDVIECEITIKNDKPREFMFLEDPIPSNCHVTEQTDLEEGTEWSFWFSGMQILEDRVGVFARTLVAGEQKIVYHLRAESPGLSHALPTRLNGMYNPGKGSFSAEGPMEVRK